MRCDTPMTLEEAKARLGIVDRQPLPMTNEEWLRSATTDELAEWLEKINEFVNVCDFIGGCQKCPFECCDDNCNNEHYQARVWLWWLKEKHTNEVAE